MKNINIAILGFGTVGQGVYQAILLNRDKLQKKSHITFNVKKILGRDLNKLKSTDYSFEINDSIFTIDFEEIKNDPTIDIVVEVMGGLDYAKKCIISALNSKKNVVTANKDLIASSGEELFDIAYKNGCYLEYEASVAGGIPIINILKTSLSNEKISSVQGILNGTSNYILSSMYSNSQMEFDEALKKAQNLGYAESDPTNDIMGFDSGRKIAILSYLAFNYPMDINSIYMQGIDKISQVDFDIMRKSGKNIKQVAISTFKNNKIFMAVYPAVVGDEDFLSAINGATNCVKITSNMLGDSMYVGAGAGSFPTGSAVYYNICAVAENISKNISPPLISTINNTIEMVDFKDEKGQYYLRMSGDKNIIENLSEDTELKISKKIPVSDEIFVLILSDVSINEINKIFAKTNYKDINVNLILKIENS